MFSAFSELAGFNLITEVRFPDPMIITPCHGIAPILLETVMDVARDLTDAGYHTFANPKEYKEITPTTTICSFQYPDKQGSFAYMTPEMGKTSIHISEILLYYPNTLYNTVLHETLHSYGLDHSDKAGVMNYSIEMRSNQFGSPRIVNDQRRSYASIDDLTGLFSSKAREHSFQWSVPLS